MKKLYRSTDDRVIVGVCGGIGNYLGVDPTVIRVLWILATVFSLGAGILVYLLAALIIPEEPTTATKARRALPAKKASPARKAPRVRKASGAKKRKR